MNLVEALKISDVIRRKDKASHVGSHGDGGIHIEMLLGRDLSAPNFSRLASDFLALDKEDLLADDWEAKNG